MFVFPAIYQSQSKHSRLVLQKKRFFKKKKRLWHLFMDDVQLSQGYEATTMTQFTFYH